MKITEKTEPFPHMVIDDFLPPDLFLEMKRLVDSMPKAKPFEKFNTSLYRNGKVNKEKFSESIKESIKLFERFVNENSVLPVNEDYWYSMEYTSTGKNYKYPQHTDSLNKFLSLVLYVSPEDGEGTILYNEDRLPNYRVKWKPNRALFFKREDNTLHSYESKKDRRLTINLNVLVNRKKSDSKKI